MSERVLPNNFEEKMRMAEAVVRWLKLKIKTIDLESNGVYKLTCYEPEKNEYTNPYFIKLNWDKNMNLSGEKSHTSGVFKIIRFKFEKLFDNNDMFYALISDDKIVRYYFKAEDGTFNEIDNFNKINIVFNDANSNDIKPLGNTNDKYKEESYTKKD